MSISTKALPESLDLKTYDDSIEAKGTKFSDFRKNIAGSNNSNMTKINSAYVKIRENIMALDLATDNDIQNIISTIV